MTLDLRAVGWPVARVGEALEALARAGGLSPRAVEMPSVPAGTEDVPPGVLDRWITDGARWLGVEAESVQVAYGEVAAMVRDAGPALLRVEGEHGARLLLLLGPGRRRVPVLGPDLRVHRVEVEAVRAALAHHLEAGLREDIDALLRAAEIPARRRERATAEILRQRLGKALVFGCWMLRLPPGSGFIAQMVHAGIPARARTLVLAQLAQYGLGLAAWWIIGRGALEGRVDRGLLLAWALILLTLVPIRLASSWSSGMLTVDLGALFKQRLLTGALRMDPEEIRHQGAGQLLGRVIESEALEALLLSVGFVSLSSVLELVLVGAVLFSGAGSWFALALFAAWVLLSLSAAGLYFTRVRRWADTRLAMTHDLVERMVGQRTRLAQESPARWHEGEDQTVARYLEDSAAMDRATRLLSVVVPRGWLVVGVVGLAPAFMATGASAGAMAVGVGGVLMAYGALHKLLSSLTSLSGALIAWRQVRPLFDAAPRSEGEGAPVFSLPTPPPRGAKETVIDAHALVYRYRASGAPVLRGVSLRVNAGDRLLLEGGSGGGKSTLGSLLAGLRVPESGLLLLRGLDWKTLGAEGWRKRVVAAPQFHENHVFASTFAFNLLMGGQWPPFPAQLEAAEAVCRELDLGPLLARMPAGLQQAVGETGWQLSHGERSRLYIARALLQGADLVVLDESFAALDPETLQRCIACVLRRARTVMVIAHP